MTEDISQVRVGVLADPGLPATLVNHLRDTLGEPLRAAVGESVSWTVDIVQDPFEAMYPGYTELMEKAREHVRDTVWDVVVCVTDQPMRGESGVFVASLDTDARIAVISLPALGGHRMRHRLRSTLVAIIAYLAASPTDTASPLADPGLRQWLPERTTRVLAPEQGSPKVHLVDRRRSALPRLLAGMIRVNRPWRLLAGMSTALAGALAGIAFGVVYSSVWTLGVAIGPFRLAGLTTVSVVALAVWIVVGHHLWERPGSEGVGGGPQVRLRNSSTVVTVIVGALAFFLSMFVIALAAVALVVPPAYLTTTLGRPAGFVDYLVIATMASVLGTLAGAVGSGLEDDTTVREATYGHREQQRRRRVEQEANDGTNPTRQYRRE